jgi:suppressor of G2 allele of SKP1
MKTKIELKLVKVNPGYKWNKLEGEDDIASHLEHDGSSGPRYPSSSKKKTDWNKLESDVKKEDDAPKDDKDPNSGGDKELNK